MLSGQLGVTSPRFSVKFLEGMGRGLQLDDAVEEGTNVLEYEAVVCSRRERQAHEKEYITNDEGCKASLLGFCCS